MKHDAFMINYTAIVIDAVIIFDKIAPSDNRCEIRYCNNNKLRNDSGSFRDNIYSTREHRRHVEIGLIKSPVLGRQHIFAFFTRMK